MRRICSALLILLTISAVLPASTAEDREGNLPADYWVEPMKQVHSRFTGRKGTFAQFGDSITVTLAFWTPLLYERRNAPKEMEQAYAMVKSYLHEPCWRQWKGGRFGNAGSQTVRWAHQNIDAWLERLNPEIALIMFGTNDLHSVPLEEYEKLMRRVVQKCLDSGTVVILSTIPPRHRMAEKAAAYSTAIRNIARDMKVPLTDFHAEILKRRPDDWDGADEKFAQYNGYDVPTLLARDGVHPSHPKQYQSDYSEKALSSCGFSLRNYMVLMKYAKVLKKLDLVPSQT